MKERLKQFFDSVGKRDAEKNDLLQSYFTSLMSLVLCVSMFLGTSYAWFTSEVNNVGNEIYIGVLDVEMEKQVGAEWKSLSETEGEGVNVTKLFDGGIRWEPGYTSLETIRVVNEGELAFKYVLQFTDGSVSKGTEQGQQLLEQNDALPLDDVAKFFDVWVFDHQKEEMEVPASFADINEATYWVNVGTLDEILAGKSILEGVMKPEEISVQKAAQNDPQNAAADENAGAHVYTIALYMNQNADASVMGHKISLNVKLVAYQMTAESGAFGSGTDENGIVAMSVLEDLSNAVNKGGNVLMTVNMGIGDTESRVTMNGGVLDGNGNKIIYNVTKEDGEPSLGVVTTTGGTVRNLTIEGGDAGRALYVTNLTSDLQVYNCTLSGAYSFNLNSNVASEFTVSFLNTTFKNWTSFDNVTDCVQFDYCTFEDVLRPYGDAKLVNCVIAEDKLDLSKLENGEAVTLVNCTYGDAEGVNIVFRAVDGKIQMERENGAVEILGSQNPQP